MREMNKNIAMNIRNYLGIFGISQQDLAEKLNCSSFFLVSSRDLDLKHSAPFLLILYSYLYFNLISLPPYYSLSCYLPNSFKCSLIKDLLAYSF